MNKKASARLKQGYSFTITSKNSGAVTLVVIAGSILLFSLGMQIGNLIG